MSPADCPAKVGVTRVTCVRGGFGIVWISWAAGNAVKRTGRMLSPARESGGAATESDRDREDDAMADLPVGLFHHVTGHDPTVGGWP